MDELNLAELSQDDFLFLISAVRREEIRRLLAGIEFPESYYAAMFDDDDDE